MLGVPKEIQVIFLTAISRKCLLCPTSTDHLGGGPPIVFDICARVSGGLFLRETNREIRASFRLDVALLSCLEADRWVNSPFQSALNMVLVHPGRNEGQTVGEELQ